MSTACCTSCPSRRHMSARSRSRLRRWLPSCRASGMGGRLGEEGGAVEDREAGQAALQAGQLGTLYSQTSAHRYQPLPLPLPLPHPPTGSSSRWKARLLCCSSSASRCTSASGTASSRTLQGRQAAAQGRCRTQHSYRLVQPAGAAVSTGTGSTQSRRQRQLQRAAPVQHHRGAGQRL